MNRSEKNDNCDKDAKTTRKGDTEGDTTSTIPDHSTKVSDQACIVYKFRSRPPYEGFILILAIVVITVLLLWWLNSGLKASETK
ncbi:hypothetical protein YASMINEVIRUS_919 [Yasminevirus sp. GU-2018]|uniref:Uncharacterized protein n=1 Tax=Yasminevirus sp. GU-2018 TaxID=2420051 RepID=A0A5K0UBI5_9VIRU|nr:hypothetical protein YASMINEVIRUS_919 [Yasminevirus sp. GU-2018]